MSSPDRNSKALPGKEIGRAVTAADIGGSTCREAAIASLRPPQTKFQYGISSGGQTHPGRLGGYQRLKIEDIQQGGFQELALKDRPPYPQYRLVREDQRPLGETVHLAGQLQPAQISQKVGLEYRPAVVTGQAPQIGDILGAESVSVQGFNDAGQPAGNGKTTPEGCAAEGEVEDGFPVLPPGLPIAIGHGQLVEIGQEGVLTATLRLIETQDHSSPIGDDERNNRAFPGCERRVDCRQWPAWRNTRPQDR